MKKLIFILLSAGLICSCGQKGPLVPPGAVSESGHVELNFTETAKILSSQV